jgi:hypothetical protein
MALPPFVFGSPDDKEDERGLLLKYIRAMPDALAEQLGPDVRQRWRPDDSQTARQTYWMNHCELCDAKQGEHFLQAPDGPFWPATGAEHDALEAVELAGPFTFVDVGWSVGPMNHWLDRRLGIERPAPKRRRRPGTGR